jgi:hypothetical protein
MVLVVAECNVKRKMRERGHQRKQAGSMHSTGYKYTRLVGCLVTAELW